MEEGNERVTSEPRTKQVELAEGLRKGIDVLDTSTPPVDQFRPSLDAPPAEPQQAAPETGDQGSDQVSGQSSEASGNAE